jgi:phosphate transport system permease protein
MRTLSANIAIEMPESSVASTHFRVLFLSALVLFVFTFMVNTVAELIRQRLRERYASL